MDCNPSSSNPIADLSAEASILLDKCSSIATKDEVKKVNDGIDSINTDLEVISGKIEVFQPRLDTAERKFGKKN